MFLIVHYFWAHCSIPPSAWIMSLSLTSVPMCVLACRSHRRPQAYHTDCIPVLVFWSLLLALLPAKFPLHDALKNRSAGIRAESIGNQGRRVGLEEKLPQWRPFENKSPGIPAEKAQKIDKKGGKEFLKALLSKVVKALISLEAHFGFSPVFFWPRYCPRPDRTSQGCINIPHVSSSNNTFGMPW